MSRDEAVDGYELDDPSKFELFRKDVEYHDEVHAIVAEVGEKDFRSKDCTFHEKAGVVTVDNGMTFRRYDVDEIVYWYPPRDF